MGEPGQRKGNEKRVGERKRGRGRGGQRKGKGKGRAEERQRKEGMVKREARGSGRFLWWKSF